MFSHIHENKSFRYPSFLLLPVNEMPSLLPCFTFTYFIYNTLRNFNIYLKSDGKKKKKIPHTLNRIETNIALKGTATVKELSRLIL